MPEPKRPLKVFLCHASTDKPKVRELYRYLKKRGIQPWFDEEDLVGGQDWQVEIPKALATSDAIIICLTKNSVDKEGYIQKEIKFALDKALEMPEGRIFLIPVKFEECEVPFSLSRYQWVDLTIESGYAKMMKALKFRASQLERSTVEVSKKDVEEENLARKKEEKEVAEKARLEAEELEIQKAAKEKAEREAHERAERERKEKEFREKQAREAREKEKRETEKKEEKPATIKPKAGSQIAYWFGGFVVLVLGTVLLSSLNNSPQTTDPTPTSAQIQDLPTSTNVVSVDLVIPSQTVQPNQTLTEVSTPTVDNNEASSGFEEIKYNNLEKITEIRSWNTIDYISSIWWAPNSKNFVMTYLYETDMSYYDLEGNIITLPNTKDITVLGFSGDGKLIGVNGFGEKVIKLYNNLLANTDYQTLVGHTQDINAIRVSADSELLVSGSSDNTIRVWRISDGVLLRTFIGHESDVGDVAISPDNNFVVSSSKDCTIRVWDIPNDKLLHKIDLQDCVSRVVEFSPDGSILASYERALWLGEQAIGLWRVDDGSLIKTLECTDSYDGSSDFQFSPDGHFLVINNCFSGGTLWSIEEDNTSLTSIGLGFSENTSFSIDNKILISGGEDILFSNLENGSLLHSINFSTSFFTNLRLSPDGRFLLGNNYENNVYLWGIPTQ